MYKKRFTADKIQLLQPYLYCTTDIVWWCWTSLASSWIQEHNSNVVNTVLRMQQGGFEWPAGTTPYRQYEFDIEGVLPWRRKPNPSSKTDELIDLQYWTLKGGLDAISRSIASRTEPKIDHEVVKGVLNQMRGVQVPVPWGGYVPCPESEMRHWHRCTKRPEFVNTGVVGQGLDAEDGRRIQEIKIQKNLPDGTKRFPDHFTKNNADPKIPRCEADMPRMAAPGALTLPAVELGKDGDVHIMPWVAHHFLSNKIVEALRYATFCSTTKTGKILLGTSLPHDQQNLRVEKITPEYLEEMIVEFDKEEGWDATGIHFNPKCGDKNLAMPSRRVGLSFDRVSALGETDALFFTAVAPAPTAMTTAEWQAKSEADTAAMGRSRRVIEDLDYHSAREQHMRCGRPLHEEVRDPRWIEKQYQKGCELYKRRTDMDMDYPYECTFELEERKEKWMTDEKVRKFNDILLESNQKQLAINRPRKPELLAKMAQKRSYSDAISSESESHAPGGGDVIYLPFMHPPAPSAAPPKTQRKKKDDDAMAPKPKKANNKDNSKNRGPPPTAPPPKPIAIPEPPAADNDPRHRRLAENRTLQLSQLSVENITK